MNPEIKEILEYLERRQDYVIWAGFAQFAHLGLKHSPDIDIYVASSEVKKQVSKDFQNRGWKLILYSEISPQWQWDSLQKNGTNFDIVYSQAAAEIIFPDSVQIAAYGHSLRFVSKEWLLITKMGQCTWANRKEDKRARDIETINILRKSVDLAKFREIVAKLPDSYWQRGEV